MPEKALRTDPASLRQFLRGEITDEQARELARRIEQDSSVRSAVQEILANDTLPNPGSSVIANDVPSLPPALAAVVRRLNKKHPAGTVLAPAAPTTAPKKPKGCDFLSAAQSNDEIGRLGGYRVLRILGEGGMGLVFEAQDTKLKRRVALKTLRMEIASTPSIKERFFREAEAAAALKHDNIVTIYQIDEDNGIPFLAMEFLEGECLADRLKKGGAMPVPFVLRIGREMAEGLAAANEMGLVHRDIKPANIWIEYRKGKADDTGRAKILDFGLARSMSSGDPHLTKSGAVVGTPAYMAPEQARGRPIDHRADLFSLGVILYEMSTGQRPFSGADTMAILTSLALDNPPPPHEINPNVGLTLSTLIMRLLAKDPNGRPHDGAEVAQSLRQIEMGLSPTVAPVQTNLAFALPEPIIGPADPWADIDASSTSNIMAAPPLPEVTPTRNTPMPPPAPKTSRERPVKTPSKDGMPSKAGTSSKPGTSSKVGTSSKTGTTSKHDALKKAPTGKYKRPVIVEPADPEAKKKKLFIGLAIAGALSLIIAVVVITMGRGKKDPGPKGTEKGPEAVDPGKKQPSNKVEPVIVYTGPDNALKFNPTAKVEMPTLLLDLTRPLTVEAYITQPRGETGQQTSLYAPNIFNLRGTGDIWAFHLSGSKNEIILKGIKPIEPNKRTHVAGVFNGKVARLFVNGELVDTKNILRENPVTLIKDRFHLGNDFEGTIDEVRVSRSARYEKEFVPAPRFGPDSDTLALYHFDEGAGTILYDSSDHTHDGTIEGAGWVNSDGTGVKATAPPPPRAREPIPPAPMEQPTPAPKEPTALPNDFALQFDGKGSYVDLPIPGFTQPYTLEARIRSKNRNRSLILAARQGISWAGLYNEGTIGFLRERSESDIFHVHSGGAKTIALAEANHLVGIWDGNVMSVYVNGVKASGSYGHLTADRYGQDAALPLEKAAVVIGALPVSGEPSRKFFFDGVIDEVRISKNVRYTNDFIPAARLEADADTIALYHFDEGQGDILKDSSPNNHHGKIVGAKWVKADGSEIPPTP